MFGSLDVMQGTQHAALHVLCLLFSSIKWTDQIVWPQLDVITQLEYFSCVLNVWPQSKDYMERQDLQRNSNWDLRNYTIEHFILACYSLPVFVEAYCTIFVLYTVFFFVFFSDVKCFLNSVFMSPWYKISIKLTTVDWAFSTLQNG